MFSIQLARQGQTMEQGTLVQWKKNEGDEIAVGEELYEIETEKAIVPIEVTRPGRLLKILVTPGDTVAVGALLALAADPGEQVSQAQLDRAVRTGEVTPEAGDTPATRQQPDAPKAADVPARKATAAPKARALAQELGIDLAKVTGTGENGLITPADVRRAAEGSSTANQPGSTSAEPAPAQGRRVRLTPIARTTVSALERAWQTPQFTQGILVDATALQGAKAAANGKLSYMDFFLDALVRAARAVPDVLARIVENEIVYSDAIDISIATATDAGLLIPVLRNAGARSIEERVSEWHRVVESARAGTLSPQQMSGGILALSNLGTRGVDYGVPLLPYSHSAIVFIGAMASRPLVVNDRLEARPSIHVAITYDHRVADGVLASRFTAAVNEALLDP